MNLEYRIEYINLLVSSLETEEQNAWLISHITERLPVKDQKKVTKGCSEYLENNGTSLYPQIDPRERCIWFQQAIHEYFKNQKFCSSIEEPLFVIKNKEGEFKTYTLSTDGETNIRSSFAPPDGFKRTHHWKWLKKNCCSFINQGNDIAVNEDSNSDSNDTENYNEKITIKTPNVIYYAVFLDTILSKKRPDDFSKLQRWQAYIGSTSKSVYERWATSGNHHTKMANLVIEHFFSNRKKEFKPYPGNIMPIDAALAYSALIGKAFYVFVVEAASVGVDLKPKENKLIAVCGTKTTQFGINVI